MGYARYVITEGPLRGQEGGYSVADTCHQAGCKAAIDRGVDSLCGDTPHGGGGLGCGLFFCGEHLYAIGGEVGLCRQCSSQLGNPCSESGCRETVAGTTGDLCGDGTGLGCGEPFCGEHLWLKHSAVGGAVWCCEACATAQGEVSR